MAPATLEESKYNLKITQSIGELETLIKDCKWWQFGRKMKYQNKLIDLRGLAFGVGMEIAMRDLVEMGILKEIPKVV